jgi:hypothetical protein
MTEHRFLAACAASFGTAGATAHLEQDAVGRDPLIQPPVEVGIVHVVVPALRILLPPSLDYFGAVVLAIPIPLDKQSFVALLQRPIVRHVCSRFSPTGNERRDFRSACMLDALSNHAFLGLAL